MLRTGIVFCAAFLCGPAVAGEPPLVATTEALSPGEQRTKFHLPPGFEIQLVVSEPLIGQPMNLNFDAAGRLWITSSVEYPYPVAGEGVEPREARWGKPSPPPAKDRVTVVEGIGANGKPAKVSSFVKGLNIPIGVVPTGDGAIVFDIPNIARHRDTDGDGLAETRTKLYGPFGNVDTHGLNNGFTRWIDGWVYACHGFSNTSKVAGRDGHVVAMNSGNTYRFREDGSRIEQFTWGQVNPFGLTFDEYGNVYSADCHSKPLTMLIRGAYYSSFGKPHDGLGFGPDMIDHGHGSTGICGPAYYTGRHFPPEYYGNIFLCNPVTGRVHRDSLIDHGSTRLVETQPDFLTCDDPWFRPVDVKVGPDGCLYVADFYNAIIGHYEVPLENPKRDRTHGRVWRIVYRGADGNVPAPPMPNLNGLDLVGLFDALNDDGLVVRRLATNAIVDRFGGDALPFAKQLLARESSPDQRAHALWIVERLEGLDADTTARLAADVSPVVRVHVVRALAERREWSRATAELVRSMLTEANGFVRRVAADAVGRHPAAANVEPLLVSLRNVPAEDTHLRHTLRIALRNQLRDDEVVESLEGLSMSETDRRTMTEIALAVRTAAAADWLVGRLTEVPREALPSALEHIAQHGSATSLTKVVPVIRKRFATQPRLQFEQLIAIRAGLRRRGESVGGPLHEWASTLATELLDDRSNESIGWTSSGAGTADGTPAVWVPQRRRCADGQESAFFSTLPSGERVTGVLRSAPFALTESLSFFVAGHCGHPNEPCHGRNVVRLRDAESGAVLAEAKAPRNDTAQRVTWKLAASRGRRVFLELVDGDAGGAYAWLAVGRFSRSELNPVDFDPAQAAADLVSEFRLVGLKPRLRRIVGHRSESVSRRIAGGAALLALAPDSRRQALLSAAAEPSLSDTLRESIFTVIRTEADDAVAPALDAVAKVLPAARQDAFLESLAADRPGMAAALSLIEAGRLSPRPLLDPGLRQRLLATGTDATRERIRRLTAGLPKRDARINEMIVKRRREFDARVASAERGRLVFGKQCAACHRIGTQGAVVGPQLDGIGVRGLDRLLEDVLDPNRNVDAAFRTTTLVLNDGRVRTGLFRREEGPLLVLADAKGKEFTIPKTDVDERIVSPVSLMPSNWGDVLSPNEFRDLTAFLLERRSPVPKR